jgi:SAM-dependent methyltransferase
VPVDHRPAETEATGGDTVTGIDQSPEFLAAAQRLAAAEGVGDRVEFLVGDVHELDFPAASFDAAVARMLLSHVRDPLAALGETARVLRPGGAVAIFDGDHASLTFGCSDPELGQAMESVLQSTIMSAPRVLCDLPRLPPQAGLRLVSTQAARLCGGGVEPIPAQPGRDLCTRRGESGPCAGRQGRVVARRPARSAGEGTFFGACNYYAYVARR